MTLSRRSLITGLISLVAAPAIVRVSSLMPVKAMAPDLYSMRYCSEDVAFAFSGFYTLYPIDGALYEQLRSGVQITGYDIMEWKVEV